MSRASELFIRIAESVDSHLGAGEYIDDVAAAGVRQNRANIEKSDLADAISEVVDIAEEDNFDDIKCTALSLKVLLSEKGLISASHQEGYEDNFERIYFSPVKIIGRSSISNIRALRDEALSCLNVDANDVAKWRNNSFVSADDFLQILQNSADRYINFTFDNIAPHVVGTAGASIIKSKLSITYEAVETDGSWQAYCKYEPGFNGRVLLNRDIPFVSSSDGTFITHEMFPGHLFESAIREYLVEQGEVSGFYALNLLYSPRSLISEGIAEYSGALFARYLSQEQRAAFWDEKLYTDIRHNTALKSIFDGIPFEQKISELARQTGWPESRAKGSMEFAMKWRYFFPLYSLGYYHAKNRIFGTPNVNWRSAYLASAIPTASAK